LVFLLVPTLTSGLTLTLGKDWSLLGDELTATRLHSKLAYILNLPTLKYRRYREDMIELFKIIKGIYDSTCVPRVDVMELSEDLIRIGGNKCKLIQHHCHYDLRKFNFTNQ